MSKQMVLRHLPLMVLLGSVLMPACGRRGGGNTELVSGPQMPDLQVRGWLNTPDGSAPDLDGKVVVYDVWAYW